MDGPTLRVVYCGAIKLLDESKAWVDIFGVQGVRWQVCNIQDGLSCGIVIGGWLAAGEGWRLGGGGRLAVPG